jgi:hypothetical protein
MHFPDQPFMAFFFKRCRDQSHLLALVSPSPPASAHFARSSAFSACSLHFLPFFWHFLGFSPALWLFIGCQPDLERIDGMVMYIVECPTPTGLLQAAAATYYFLAKQVTETFTTRPTIQIVAFNTEQPHCHLQRQASRFSSPTSDAKIFASKHPPLVTHHTPVVVFTTGQTNLVSNFRLTAETLCTPLSSKGWL